MSDDISFQTWICPACHDDHAQSMGCYKKIAELKKKLQQHRKFIARRKLQDDFNRFLPFDDADMELAAKIRNKEA